MQHANIGCAIIILNEPKTIMLSLKTILLTFLLAKSATFAADVRVVTKDELSKKTGVDTDEIWLSIMGEVYDVSSGKQYYGEGSGYSIFAGRDGSVPFITGVFTPEEADKSIDVLEDKQLHSLDHWAKFYREEDKYPFIGLLEGYLYDKDGNPTEKLIQIRETIAKEDIVFEQKKKEREERIAERKKKAAEKKAAEEL